MNQKREHDFDNTMNERTDFGFNDQVGRINFGPGIDRVTASEAGKYVPKVPDVRDEPKQFEPIDGPDKPEAPKPNMKVIYMDKVKRYLQSALKGENLIGQLLFTVFDILPGGGSISELIKAITKKAETSGLKAAINERIDRMQWLRFVLTAALFLGALYAFVTGVITADDLVKLIGALL
jgi:hypothetical protein